MGTKVIVENTFQYAGKILLKGMTVEIEKDADLVEVTKRGLAKRIGAEKADDKKDAGQGSGATK
jgi:hypothetical protein